MSEDLKDKPQFRDATGDLWTIRITTPVISETCLALASYSMELSDLTNQSALRNPGVILEWIWRAVKIAARSKQVTREQFEAERLTPPFISDAASALGVAFELAFPTPKQLPEKLRTAMEEEAASRPLG